MAYVCKNNPNLLLEKRSVSKGPCSLDTLVQSPSRAGQLTINFTPISLRLYVKSFCQRIYISKNFNIR